MIQANATFEIYRALSDLARRYQFRSRDEVCCYGLTVSQCYALEFLADRDSVSTGDLAQSLGLDLSSTTRLVDQLVRKKLVTRQKSEEDARIRNIQVTDSGMRLARRVQEDMVKLLESALSSVPAAVLESLPDVLQRITTALNECCEMPTVIPAASIRKI